MKNLILRMLDSSVYPLVVAALTFVGSLIAFYIGMICLLTVFGLFVLKQYNK